MSKLSAETRDKRLKILSGFKGFIKQSASITHSNIDVDSFYSDWIKEVESLEVEPKLSAFKSGDLIAVGDKLNSYPLLRYFKEYQPKEPMSFKVNGGSYRHVKHAKLFTPHNGGEMPECLKGKVINVLFRSTYTSNGFAGRFNWIWDGKTNDIIGYEIIGEER